MRREEEIASAFYDYRDALKLSTFGDFEYIDIQEAFEEGAKWADNHPINVWHDASEEPTIEQTHILATNEKDIIEVFPLHEGRKYNLNGNLIDWSRIIVYFNLTKWAYIDDLLPKGGEK